MAILCKYLKNIFVRNQNLTSKFDLETYIVIFLFSLSHFGRGFDHQFIMKTCMKIGVRAQCKFSGNKILSIRLPNGVIFIDFFNFCPGSLRKIASSFGLEERKTYFPFKLLKRENFDMVLNQLPSKEQYEIDLFSKTELEDFELFYEEEKKNSFSLTLTCNKYVERDVFVLAQCSAIFIKVTMQMEHALLIETNHLGRLKGSITPVLINNKLHYIDNSHIFSEQFVTLSNYTNHLFRITNEHKLPIYDNQVNIYYLQIPVLRVSG